MSDKLSEDLLSLKIDRDATATQPRRNWFPFIVVLLLLGGGAAAVYILYPKIESSLFRTQVAYTDILLMSPAQASVELTANGYVVPESVSRVGVQIQGRVARVLVKEGDLVKKGQLLMELDNSIQRSAIAEARARLFSAKARAQNARANLAEIKQQAERQRKLATSGAAPLASATDLEARVSTLQESISVADAEVLAEQAGLEALNVNLQLTKVYAPMNGTVIAKPREVGEMVTSMVDNVALLEIADLTSLVVEADVPEARLSIIKPKGPCEIVLDAYPGERLRGEMLEVRPKINRAKATVPVKVRFVDLNERVLPEMAARVSFLSKALDESSLKERPKIVVPASAVAERNGRKVVFVVQSNKVKAVPIELGPAFANGFEVKQGPTPGTRLVDRPAAQLTDGQSVKEQE